MGGKAKVPSVAKRARCTRAVLLKHVTPGRSKTIDARLLFDIADALEVSPRWLLTGSGSRRGLLHDEAEMLYAYRAQPPDVKALILAMIAKFSGESSAE